VLVVLVGGVMTVGDIGMYPLCVRFK